MKNALYSEKNVTVEEWNKIFQEAKEGRVLRMMSIEEAHAKGICLDSWNLFIEIKAVTVKMTFRDYNLKTHNYVTRLDGLEVQSNSAMNNWRTFNKYYKVPKLHELGGAEYSASPIQYRNKSLINEYTKGVTYDLNSAYAYALKVAPLPDTSVEPRINSILQPGEIGFLDGKAYTTLGIIYEYVFPILSGEQRAKICQYVDKYYNLKKNEKNKAKKQGYKNALNIPIGYCQRCNWFIRSAVITFCNNIIKTLIRGRKDVLYCNTDSICIVSINGQDIKPLDVKIGSEIGEWKIEHDGYVCLTKSGYHWKGEAPTISGVSKCLLSDVDDIREWRDSLGRYPYKFDENKGVITNG